jgi:hypothetical protein
MPEARRCQSRLKSATAVVCSNNLSLFKRRTRKVCSCLFNALAPDTCNRMLVVVMPWQGGFSIERRCQLAGSSPAALCCSVEDREPVKEDMEVQSVIQRTTLDPKMRSPRIKRGDYMWSSSRHNGRSYAGVPLNESELRAKLASGTIQAHSTSGGRT